MAEGAALFRPAIIPCMVFWLCLSLIVVPSYATADTRRLLTQSEIKSDVSKLQEMKLHTGQNDEYFAGIDQQGYITVDYMDFGMPGSHNLYLITTDDEDDNLQSVIIPTGENQDEVLDDAPFDGELIQKSVRFSNGLFKGAPATLLYISTLESSALSNPDGAKARISVQILRSVDGDFPPFQFQQVSTFVTSETFYIANDALKSALSVPSP
jgi:hypothetical protein